MRLRARLAAISLALAAAATPARADYPDHAITLIVPFPAGGGVDAMARLVAEKFANALGRSVVIDNRGGAAGVIGTRAAAKAVPDGYTLVMATSGTTSINPTLYVNPGYDPRKDFVPIGVIAATPIVLMAHPSLPARSIAELIRLANSQNGELQAGTPPPGTENYLAAELFRDMTGIPMTIVSYKGTGPLTNDLLGGHIRLAFNTTAPALGNIQAGALRAIAVAGLGRSALLPDVPTVIESGLPGFEAVVRYGLLAPAGTPQPIIDRLSDVLRTIVASNDARRRILAQGAEPLTGSPADYVADIAREEAKWAGLIRKLGLKVE
jgi:tripartite-type tricarboxylate transporter receptor subunit TctC